MNKKIAWKMVKNRYRLAAKIQMNFELSFPKYLIGTCRITTENRHEEKTQKVALSTKGMVFSDTIPLSWFTSSVLIPWEKILKISVRENSPSANEPNLSPECCTLHLEDPLALTLDLPWSSDFTDHLKKHQYLDI